MPERIARLVADAVGDEVMDVTAHEAIDDQTDLQAVGQWFGDLVGTGQKLKLNEPNPQWATRPLWVSSTGRAVLFSRCPP